MAPTIGVNLRVTGHCNQGSRKHMEDMFSVAYQQTEDELDLEYAYFGIFDGHGGHEAATFAKEHLMKAIVSQSGFWSNNDKDVLRAIKEGFIATHYAMWRNLENWPKTQSGWPSTSGTTASVAFIRRSNIYIGHVGDSCIVLGHQDPCSDDWTGARLTMDHKPEHPMEHKRINQAGGMVIEKSGVPRVVWHRPRASHKGPLTRSTQIDQIPFLAVARSLGDLWSYNADSDRFVVSPEPDVSVHHIDLTRDRCLIFGTDGLWNMLSPQEAVSIVREAESNNKSSSNDGLDQGWLNPSKCLVDSALKKWMQSKVRADNTSAVTLLLDPLGPPHSQVLDQQNSASQPQSEFVPYHIESYKINEGKSSNKFPHQSSGLAICTWYPNKSCPDGLSKNDGLTTLSTMEELFGEKVEIVKKSESPSGNDAEEEETKCRDVEPSTSRTTEGEAKRLPLAHSTILRNANRSNSNSSCADVEESTATPGGGEGSNDEDEAAESSQAREECGSSKENNGLSQSAGRMKLRDGVSGRKLPERASSDETMDRSCRKTNFHVKPMRRNSKRGKKRKNYEIIESEFNLLNSMRLRSKNKRRHSSLIETMNENDMYEPRPKRRTRSEDQRKNYESEECKSDTENKLGEDAGKGRKVTKLKMAKTPERESEAPETSEENQKQKHLQERLHHNSNSNSSNNTNGNSNSGNNNNNNNSHSNNSGNNNANVSNNSNNSSNSNNNSSPDFTPMRLRSNVPVKTLRSRNINLENCDWFVIGLSKFNVAPIRKSLTKQTCKADESGPEVGGNKAVTKVSNVLPRNSLSSGKLQMSETPHGRSSVHTRSQNKRLRK